MNRVGANLFVAILIAAMIFTSGMLFTNYLKDEVTTARSSSALDCSNSSISDGAKLTCLGTDLAIPIWIFWIIAAAGGAVAARLLI